MPWRLGIMRGLDSSVESEILKDVVRLVAGNQDAYKTTRTGQWLVLPDGGRGYVWPDVDNATLPVRGES